MRLGEAWWTFMVRGVLAGVLGLCALIWPTVSVEILIRLVGIYCLVDGAVGLVGSLRTADRPYLLQAIFGVVVGLVLLFWPGGTARVLLMVFGVWALVTGISQVVAARALPVEDPDRGLRTTLGGVAAAVGLVLLVWPGTGVVTISWVIALAALAVAAILIFLALRLKRLGGAIQTLRERDWSPPE